VLAQRYPIERVAGGLVLVWGISLMTTVGCTSFRGLYAQRFFLGFLEAGISPIFMLVVGGWYEKCTLPATLNLLPLVGTYTNIKKCKAEQALRMGVSFPMLISNHLA
jgi:hypothetical protein